MSKTGLRKSGRFVIFWTPFYRFWSLLGPIRIYRKTAPTKSTVLGPGPPPGIFNKIYRFSRFFTILGPSIEPEKPSVKSASTPYPPRKVNFIVILLIRDPIYQYFNSSLPITELFAFLFGVGIVSLLFRFLVLSRIVYSSFSGFESSLGTLITCWLRY
jgi:hypothetical protein